ncbi:MAG TPA: PAS domain S-box protein [Candidatus Hydrogenedentes bacterium]|nr:PAS domain S-box protein [Candidatus Hydrogenedentota bacterium]
MKWSQFVSLAVAYLVTLVFLAVISIYYAFPHLMFAMVVPILFAGLLYPRRMYLMMTCMLIPASLVVVQKTLPDAQDAWKTMAALFVMVLATAEILHKSLVDRKRAEAALRASEERYRSLVENLPIGIYRNTPGPHGALIMANSALARIHGFDSVAELLDTPVGELYADAAERARFSHKLVLEGNVQTEELRLKKKDGALIWGAVTARVVRGPAGDIEYFDGMVEDITDRKQAEQTIAEQQAKMVNASRLSSLGAMASGIAHEINNPLAVISTAAEHLAGMIRREEFDQALFAKLVDTISRNGERIERIIRGLRNLARDGANEPFSPKSLRSLVEDTVELCKVRFRNHGVELVVSDIAPDIAVECCATQLSQVLINLLNNAESAVEGLDEKWVHVAVEDEGESIELSVTDSGPGVPPELREKVLEPFFTTKEVGKGTGLGLSISKAIVDRHRGELFIDEGSPHSRFVVRLPKRRLHVAPDGGVHV